MTKKILITVSSATIARNILRSGVTNHLRSESCKIFLVVPEEKYLAYREEFGATDVEVYRSPQIKLSLAQRLLSFLGRNAFATETIRMWQKMEFHWNHKLGVYIVKRLLWLIFGKSRLFHSLIRRSYDYFTPQEEFIKLLWEISPNLVFITDAFPDMDIAFWHGAKKLGIQTVVMVRSWDNLTNHGLVRIMPDKLIVHNPFLKKLAITLHHIPESKITMVGLPHYDWYTREDLWLSREDFFKKMGLDPSRKLILFAGIGNYLAPHEWEVAKIIDEAMEKGQISYLTTMLFRPHPGFLTQHEKIKSLKNVIFDEEISKFIENKELRGEMEEKDMAHLVNSLRHADLVITTASSITIDVVAFDRPVICIAFDGESKEPYWNSVARYYRDFTHYKLITQTGGFKLAYNKEDLIQYINDYLRDPPLDKEGRKKIFDDYIWKLDGKSAQRLAETLLKTNL